MFSKEEDELEGLDEELDAELNNILTQQDHNYDQQAAAQPVDSKDNASSERAEPVVPKPKSRSLSGVRVPILSKSYAECLRDLTEGTEAYKISNFEKAHQKYTQAQQCKTIATLENAPVFQSTKYAHIMCLINLSAPHVEANSYWFAVLGKFKEREQPALVDAVQIQKFISEAERHLEELRSFCQKHKRTFMLLHVAQARLSLRCFDKPKAQTAIDVAKKRLERQFHLQPCYMPGSDDTLFNESRKEQMQKLLDELMTESVALDSLEPWFVCRYENCPDKSPSYKYAPSFNGCFIVHCTSFCQVGFHHNCFKDLEKSKGGRRDFLKSDCITPDCGAPLSKYEEFGTNCAKKNEFRAPADVRKVRQAQQNIQALSNKNLRKLCKKTREDSRANKSESESQSGPMPSFNMRPPEPRVPTPEEVEIEDEQFQWREEQENVPPPDIPAVPLKRSDSEDESTQWSTVNKKNKKHKKREIHRPLTIDVVVKKEMDERRHVVDDHADLVPMNAWGRKRAEEDVNYGGWDTHSDYMSPPAPIQQQYHPPVAVAAAARVDEHQETEHRIEALAENIDVQHLLGLITGIINNSFSSGLVWMSISDLENLLLVGSDQPPALTELLCLTGGLGPLLARQGNTGRYSFVVDDLQQNVTLRECVQQSFVPSAPSSVPFSHHSNVVVLDEARIVDDGVQQLDAMINAWQIQPEPNEHYSLEMDGAQGVDALEARPDVGEVEVEGNITEEEMQRIRALEEKNAELEEQLREQRTLHWRQVDELHKKCDTHRAEALQAKEDHLVVHAKLTDLQIAHNNLRRESGGGDTTQLKNRLEEEQRRSSQLKNDLAQLQLDVMNKDEQTEAERQRAGEAEVMVVEIKRRIIMTQLDKDIEELESTTHIARELKDKCPHLSEELGAFVSECERIEEEGRLERRAQEEAFEQLKGQLESGRRLETLTPVPDPRMPRPIEPNQQLLHKLNCTTAVSVNPAALAPRPLSPPVQQQPSYTPNISRSSVSPVPLAPAPAPPFVGASTLSATQMPSAPPYVPPHLRDTQAMHLQTQFNAPVKDSTPVLMPTPAAAAPVPSAAPAASDPAPAAPSEASEPRATGSKVAQLKVLVTERIPDVSQQEFKDAVRLARTHAGPEGFKMLNGKLDEICGLVVQEIRLERCNLAARMAQPTYYRPPSPLAEVVEKVQPSPDLKCCICVEIFNAEDRMMLKCKGCKEIYHQWCLFQWLEDNCTCPKCRRALQVNYDMLQ